MIAVPDTAFKLDRVCFLRRKDPRTRVQDAEFREGIAALMIRHKNMAARSKKVGGKGGWVRHRY